jgi:hypothetical protein
MKTKLSLRSPLASLALICSFTSLVLPANAASPKAPRWFEIEVIFFKQLGDKTLLNEKFTESELPKYSRSFDLLTSYLQPDISALKQLLPYCHSQNTLAEKVINELNIEESIIPTKFITTKTLQEIDEQLFTFQEDSYISDDSATNELDRDPSVKTTPLDNTALTFAEGIIDERIDQQNDAGKFNASENELIVEEAIPLTPEQLSLITLAADAKQHFIQKQFENYALYPSFTKRNVCQIAPSYFQNILPNEKLASFNFYGFPVTAVPRVIDAAHKSNTTTPYLMSKDALRLGDITKRLKWSKNFRPLMHLGWRQIGVTRNKAIPMKLYAGENLAEQYQQALDKELSLATLAAFKLSQQSVTDSSLLDSTIDNLDGHQTANDSAIKRSSINNSSINNSSINNRATNNLELSEEALKKRSLQEQTVQSFNDIFSQIDSIDDETLAPLLAKLNNPYYDITHDKNQLDSQRSHQLTDNGANHSVNHSEIDDKKLSTITEPSQPWLLDGFIKVHLDHFLYVTADFNMATQEAVNTKKEQAFTLVETSAIKTSQVVPETKEKVIHFSQDRRIVTGEVHYFDHPYIGMVVQIRRFDPTKPEDEAVTQVVR